MSAGSSSPDTFAVSRRAVRRTAFVTGMVVILAVIIILAVIAFQVLQPADSLAAQVNSRDYQAVFLTSNEVYFGKLDVPSGNFVYLRHVYRLTEQPASRSGKSLQRTLVKITSDVHDPLDQMIINRSTILYVENLNPNGQAAHLLDSGGP